MLEHARRAQSRVMVAQQLPLNTLRCLRLCDVGWLNGERLVLSGVSSSNITTDTRGTSLEVRSQIRYGNPPNLSILFSGGKDRKFDSLSNGE